MKTTTLRDVVLSALYLLVACAPVIGLSLKFPDAHLDGALAPLTRPALTRESWVNEKFQPAFAAWFESSLWLRNAFVYADNSVLFHGFNETKPGAPVKIQKHHVLFIQDDVTHYSSVRVVPPEVLPDYTSLVGRLQRRLTAEGAALVPVIVPSKGSLYADEMDDAWKTPVPSPRPSDVAYQNLVKAMKDAGIAFVDGRAMLTSRPEPRTHVFAPGARHWSYYASCLITQEVLRTYASLTHKAAPQVDCDYEMRTNVPLAHEDFDLVRLLNVWNPPIDRSGAAILLPQRHEVKDPIDLLIVGTSFCWFFLKDSDRTHAFKNQHFLYYNALQIEWPMAGPSPKVVAHSPSWNKAVLGKKLYLIDTFEIYDPSLVFLTDLERALNDRDAAAAPH